MFKQQNVETKIQHLDKTGELYISSIFGSTNIISEEDGPKGEIVLFFCSECNTSLLLNDLCEECKAPLAYLELKNGRTFQNKVQCSKK